MYPLVLTLATTCGVLTRVGEPSAQYWNQYVHGLVVVSARQRVWACSVAPVEVMSVGRVDQPSQAVAVRATVTRTARALILALILIDPCSREHGPDRQRR